MARNYKKEYANYDGTPAVKKKRANRNTARRRMVKAGLAKKGDGKDVHHTTGNPMNNSRLSVKSKNKTQIFGVLWVPGGRGER